MSISDDAQAIWKAGVAAVYSDQLVRDNASVRDARLIICKTSYSLADVDRIIVVGAGKAGAGMAAGLEQALGPELVAAKVTGWVNVPADCLRPLERIHLHAARPAGVNEPTAQGVAGATEILKLVELAGPRDIVLVLLSGGGSALLPAPVESITLEDKQAVTRFLMRSGADIGALNTVRKQLSRIKGGGLARALGAGVMHTLIISDVSGDPLDLIASGPTVADSSTPAAALEVLRRFSKSRDDIPEAVWKHLEATAHAGRPAAVIDTHGRIHNQIIGNNARAVEAACQHAAALGYQVHSLGADLEGEANTTGQELAELCLSLRQSNSSKRPVCVISGGEPVVTLAPSSRPRKGGRNQQLVLAAVDKLWDADWQGLCLLSGGTDGEDGPTDAAGALADTQIVQRARQLGLHPQEELAINNSYGFFKACGGLLKTGPTHTNVMDLRVAIIS